jgi:hypothetical protein
MSNWKAFEKRIAKLFGGKRKWRMGNWGESDEDIINVEDFVIECKYVKRSITRKFIIKALRQAIGYNEKKYEGKKLSIVASGRVGGKDVRITMSIKSLLRWVHNNPNWNKRGGILVSLDEESMRRLLEGSSNVGSSRGKRRKGIRSKGVRKRR